LTHVLITGGSGFLGRSLAKKFRDQGDIVILGSRDHGMNVIAQKETGCMAVPLDVSSINSVRDVIGEFKPETVIHAAAAKFVDISEKNPMECVDTNILGSQNVIRVSIEQGVKTLIGVSTDKAASPENMYGFSKAVMERMFQLMSGKSETQMACVRFGNIVWATGSVLPIWRRVYQAGGTLRATNMRRFFFTVAEASDLVLTATRHIKFLSGKILVRAMKVASISDLAQVWTEVHGGKWETMDGRPGDKVNEDLIGASEYGHAYKYVIDGETYYIIDFSDSPERDLEGHVSTENSPELTRDEIRDLILSEG
jgi:UDP-N-acetylglucosamine 4,6-dehydratase/5-epimerase